MRIIIRFFWSLVFILGSAVFSYLVLPSTRENIKNDAIPEIAFSTCRDMEAMNTNCFQLEYNDCYEGIKKAGHACLESEEFAHLNDELVENEEIKNKLAMCVISPIDPYAYKVPVSATCIQEAAKYLESTPQQIAADLTAGDHQLSIEAEQMIGRQPASL